MLANTSENLNIKVGLGISRNSFFFNPYIQLLNEPS